MAEQFVTLSQDVIDALRGIQVKTVMALTLEEVLAAADPKRGCDHCMHIHKRADGPIHMVIEPGHVLVKCCKCRAAQTQHIDHWREYLTKRVLQLR